MLAFPLHLKLMTDPSFPFGAIGLVHIHNRITQHRPIDAGETLAIKVWSGPIEPHPRGRQFGIHTEARAGDELVWHEVSTNLRRAGGRSEEGNAPDNRPQGDPRRGVALEASGLPITAVWRLPGDLGRRYGSVSGDLNPIHIHPLTARPFGFPSAIAHGMWTKARCLAALQARLPPAFTVEVAFKRPILLPATVAFAEGAGENGIAFGVRDKRKDTPHLDGRVTFA
jgi:acyl dehydratase